MRTALLDCMAVDPTYPPVLHWSIVWWDDPSSPTIDWPAPRIPTAAMIQPPGMDSSMWSQRESLTVPIPHAVDHPCQ